MVAIASCLYFSSKVFKQLLYDCYTFFSASLTVSLPTVRVCVSHTLRYARTYIPYFRPRRISQGASEKRLTALQALDLLREVNVLSHVPPEPLWLAHHPELFFGLVLHRWDAALPTTLSSRRWRYT